MAAKKQTPADAGRKDHAEPEWARGLRDLYDDVVEEPLPPSFHDLLSKLDKPKK